MTPSKFIKRLSKLNIQIELIANYPWIYLKSVNNKKVTRRFEANHGFCIFYLTNDSGYKFSNRKEVFKEIRKTLKE